MTDLLDRHNRLSRYLVDIDILDIERAFETSPRILQEAGELAAKAEHVKYLARYNIQIAEAAAAHRLRQVPVNGKEPSQARIDSMLPLEPEVQEATQAFGEASYEARVCEVLYESLRSQWTMLHKVADLTSSGFFNPAVLQDQRRAEMRRAYQEADQRGKARPIVRPTA